MDSPRQNLQKRGRVAKVRLGQRLEKKGRAGKYVVVAAMRKLLRLIYGVIKQGRPFDPNWTMPCPRLAQTPTPALA